MEVWTAVVLGEEDGTYYGTSVALTEAELIEMVRENFDPEGLFTKPFTWDAFGLYLGYYVEVNNHTVGGTS